jgi:hypothetical protein
VIGKRLTSKVCSQSAAETDWKGVKATYTKSRNGLDTSEKLGKMRMCKSVIMQRESEYRAAMNGVDYATELKKYPLDTPDPAAHAKVIADRAAAAVAVGSFLNEVEPWEKAAVKKKEVESRYLLRNKYVAQQFWKGRSGISASLSRLRRHS